MVSDNFPRPIPLPLPELPVVGPAVGAAPAADVETLWLSYWSTATSCIVVIRFCFNSSDLLPFALLRSRNGERRG